MIIEPIKTKDGRVMNNVECVRYVSKILNYLRDGTPVMSESKKQQNYLKWLEICGGEETRANKITDFYNAIAKEKNDQIAQMKLENGLIPLR